VPEQRLDFSFDRRVATDYDAVRGHPPAVSAEIGRVIANEIGEGALLFEPGVGTGRIALPALAAGCEVVGADLSTEMLSALNTVSNRETGRLHLVRCNLDHLPFKPQVFDAVLCVHVLHLIADWHALLTNLLRLTKPGGTIMLGRDWIDPQSFAGKIRHEFRMAAVQLSEQISAPPGARAFVGRLIELGAQPVDEGQERTAAEWQTKLTPRQVLDQIREKDDAESWVLPDELLVRVMERLDAFAASEFEHVDKPLPVTRRFVYSQFRVPQA